MMDNESLSVVVAEANPWMRHGVIAIIQSVPGLRVTGRAGDARVAAQLCVELQPDLVVTDLFLPHGDGLEVLCNGRRQNPRSRWVIVSSINDASTIQRALRAGACGYVTKQDESAELTGALEKAMVNESFCSSMTAGILLADVRRKSPGKALQGLAELTNREWHVFRCLAEGQGTTRMARDLGLSVKTIETHLRHINDKLSLHSIQQLRRLADEWQGTGGKRDGESGQKTRKTALFEKW